MCFSERYFLWCKVLQISTCISQILFLLVSLSRFSWPIVSVLTQIASWGLMVSFHPEFPIIKQQIVVGLAPSRTRFMCWDHRDPPVAVSISLIHRLRCLPISLISDSKRDQKKKEHVILGKLSCSSLALALLLLFFFYLSLGDRWVVR